MRGILTRSLFLPSLGWNIVRAAVSPNFRWRDRIDENVVLGALPFPHHVAALSREGVRAVVNTCAEYSGPTTGYARAGIDQLHLPTLDFTSPSRRDVDRALVYMGEFAARGESIYVHCKAGRGRSATVVLCWLMMRNGLTPGEAQLLLLRRRPQVDRYLDQREVVRTIYADLSRTRS